MQKLTIRRTWTGTTTSPKHSKWPRSKRSSPCKRRKWIIRSGETKPQELNYKNTDLTARWGPKPSSNDKDWGSKFKKQEIVAITAMVAYMSQQNIVKCCSSKADGHAYITGFRRKTSYGLAEGRYDHTIICGGIYSSIILDHSGQYKLCVIID